MQAWATSHSHDEDLLVVLCINCHAEAHTTRELGRNLTSEELLKHKEIWTSFVSRSDAQTLLSRNARPELLGFLPVWDYFNHRRIVRTATQMGIDPTSMPSYASLGQNANIDVDGGIDWGAISNDRRDTTSFMYEGAIRNAEGVYNYFADLLTSVVCESDWVDLRSCWSKPKLKAMVTPGVITLLTAGFRYRSADTMSSKGPGQIRSGYYQKAGIRLQFTFDGWEITSVSSRGNLSGIWRSAAVCLVRSIDFDCSPTVIETTCLGIGTGFDNSCYPGPIVAQFDTETDV
jgi:hypothetical protein